MIDEQRKKEIGCVIQNALDKMAGPVSVLPGGSTFTASVKLEGRTFPVVAWIGAGGTVVITADLNLDVDEELYSVMGRAVHLANVFALSEGTFDYHADYGAVKYRIALPVLDSVFDESLVYEAFRLVSRDVEWFFPLFEGVTERRISFDEVLERFNGINARRSRSLMRDRVKAKPIEKASKVFDTLCSVLDDKYPEYVVVTEGEAVEFLMNGYYFDVKVAVKMDAKSGTLTFCVPLPINFDQEKSYDLVDAFNKLNYAMAMGCFDFDYLSSKAYFRVTVSFVQPLVGYETINNVLEIIDYEVQEKSKQLFLLNCRYINPDEFEENVGAIDKYDISDEYMGYIDDDDDDD